MFLQYYTSITTPSISTTYISKASIPTDILTTFYIYFKVSYYNTSVSKSTATLILKLLQAKSKNG